MGIGGGVGANTQVHFVHFSKLIMSMGMRIKNFVKSHRRHKTPAGHPATDLDLTDPEVYFVRLVRKTFPEMKR